VFVDELLSDEIHVTLNLKVTLWLFYQNIIFTLVGYTLLVNIGTVMIL